LIGKPPKVKLTFSDTSP